MKKLLLVALVLLVAACSRSETPVADATQSTATEATTTPATQSTASMPEMATTHERGAPEQVAADAPILQAKQLYNPAAAEVYQMAEQIPDRLDKLYCYCHCHQHMKHRSLRTCFQTHHAEECNICMHEAVMAYNDWKAGKSVADTQKQADATFNGGMPPPSI